MTLRNRISELVAACFTGIWVESQEHSEAIAEIAGLCREEGWQLRVWNLDQGLTTGSATETSAAADPLTALRTLNSVPIDDSTTILIMQNLHRFVASTEIMQAHDTSTARPPGRRHHRRNHF